MIGVTVRRVVLGTSVLGLLALGPKFGGDIFSGEDMDILRVVAQNERLAALADIDNVLAGRFGRPGVVFITQPIDAIHHQIRRFI